MSDSIFDPTPHEVSPNPRPPPRRQIPLLVKEELAERIKSACLAAGLSQNRFCIRAIEFALSRMKNMP